MGAKIQHEVDIINKKRIQSKSKSTSVSDPILHSKSKSTFVSDPIISPPICDSTIETSTIPYLSQHILTPTNPTMSNTTHLKEKKCDMCDNLIKVTDALDRDKENPLYKFCVTCFKEATKQASVSNELETNTNSKMVVEGDEENK